MSRPNTPNCKTLNWPACNDALKRCGSLTIRFDPGMAWSAKPIGKRRRQPLYGDAAFQTGLTMNVLFGMALRQTTRFVECLMQLVGLDWDVPEFSTLGRRQMALDVDIPHRRSQSPLHLLIDGTGIKVEDEGEWNARKQGRAKRRAWRKINLGIDEQSLEIRPVEVVSSEKGDAPILPELYSQIPPDQEIASVTADGAYDTRKCHDAIAERSAAAVIPPCRNAKLWKADSAEAAARNETPRASKHLGRALSGRSSGYCRRSRAETKMLSVKLLGQRLMARDFDRQVAELRFVLQS